MAHRTREIHVPGRAWRGTTSRAVSYPASHQGTERGFLLARQPTEFGCRTARFGTPPLHQRQHLQH